MHRRLERPDLPLEFPVVLDKPTNCPLWLVYLFWVFSCVNGQTPSPSW